jgi:hypothetical protein
MIGLVSSVFSSTVAYRSPIAGKSPPSAPASTAPNSGPPASHELTGASPARDERQTTVGDGGRGKRPADLSTEDELAIRELEARDAEVRAHEQAHVSAGGQYVSGGPTYEYETGPDGRRYAVGGEVNIDVSKERNPESTIRKAQTVRAAALAPADPSSKDRQVASRASSLEREARAELAEATTAATPGSRSDRSGEAQLCEDEAARREDCSTATGSSQLSRSPQSLDMHI